MKFETERLNLHPLTLNDTDDMAAINADPKVMEHFPAPMTASQTKTFMQRVVKHWEDNGFGLCALEIRETGAFIGFTGLTHPPYETPFTPCVEVGWRLNPAAWGQGFAYEAARACLKWGFGGLRLNEIVSFTTITNTRSSGLMKRLGMQHDLSEDFDHPMLETDSPLLRHVLYRLNRENWRDAA